MKSGFAGILGGIGPMATVYFMEMILNMTKAECDQEHLNMLVSNHATIPDRTDYILGGSTDSPLDVMVQDAKMLEQAGCDFVVIPCNTAHYFFDSIQQAIEIPLLNIIKETVRYCRHHAEQVHTIGIMATEGTIQSETYAMECRKYGIECIHPDKELQEQVTHIIYDCVKAGRPVDEQDFTNVVNTLLSQGCDMVVLGCTELSVAFRDLDLAGQMPQVVDSLTVLAQKTILFAGKELRHDVSAKHFIL